MGVIAPLAGKDSFVDLERQRRRLEDNIQQLRKSLQHWQLWEAEYEGLKEEIVSLSDDQSAITIDQLERVGNEFGGDLLNQKDVQENIKALERRLTAAEQKLQSATAMSQPYSTDEEGLPLTEIREELDDDGNIISSTLSKPGDSTPQVLEALQKAGVEVVDREKIEPNEGSEPPEASEPPAEPLLEPFTRSEPHVKKAPQVGKEPQDEREPQDEKELQIKKEPQVKYKFLSKDAASTRIEDEPKQRGSPLARTREVSPANKPINPEVNDATERLSHSTKKSVSFSETAQIQTLVSPAPTNHASHHGRKTSQDLRNEILLEEQKPFERHTHAEDIKPGSSISSPIIPLNESPEEATLRRQMLDYNMNEVGPVVAEIDIDDNGSYDSERFDESDDTDAEDEDDEGEDEYGRTTRRVIDDEYRAQMLALEKKINTRMMENVGLHDDMNNRGRDSNPLQPVNDGALKKIVNEKKGVRFANNIDVSEPKDAVSVIATTATGPLSDVIEHSSSSNAETRSSKTKKPSKFKSSRLIRPDYPETVQQQSSAVDIDKPRPSFAPGEIYAGTVLERAPPVQMNDAFDSLERVTIPAPPDEYDDVTMNQELAMEYNRLRNRMIQRQGGFMQATNEEENERPKSSDLFGEPKPDGGKKVSRFKAARLAGLDKSILE